MENKRRIRKKANISKSAVNKKSLGHLIALKEVQRLKTLVREIKASKKVENTKSSEKTIKVRFPKLIDTLHEALVKAGLEVERDGWKENESSNPPNDNCEWLDIPMKDKSGNIYTVHFYFSHDSKVLDNLQIFKSKVEYSAPERVAGEYKEREKPEDKPVSKKSVEKETLPYYYNHC